jgi:hypothetical protein
MAMRWLPRPPTKKISALCLRRHRRHTFVVRRIVQWQAQGVNIDQAMLSLSTYVGHTMVTNTYWYLSAVPELMALAAGRFESFTARREVQDA